MTTHRRNGLAALLLAEFLFSGAAQAALYGVAHEIAGAKESLVRVSTANANITDDAATALTNCCRVNGSLVASDDATQTAYFVTPDANLAQPWRLHRINLATGSAQTATLSTNIRIAAILRRGSPAALFGLGDDGSGLRLLTISDAGVVGSIGAPFLTNCCAMRVGVAALSTDGSRIGFVARLNPPAGDPAPRLLVVNTASGAVISNAVLTRVPDVLVASGANSFAAIYHDAGSERFGTIAGDGTITPIVAGLANCCEIAAGVSARDGNIVYITARDFSATTLSLISVNAGTGAFTVIGALDTGYVVHGLVQSSVTLASDVIFRDGFEILPPLAQGEDKSMTMAATLAASATPNSAASAMRGSVAHADSSTIASVKDVDQITGGPQQVTELPVGNPALWSVLVMLLTLVGMRHWRRRV